MSTDMKAAAEQILETLASSRATLTERLERWDSLTATALVGQQWVICSPDSMAAYKLITLRELGNGQAEYESRFCSLADAPLYSERASQKVLEVQRGLRAGQELAAMHIREAITIKLQALEDEEACIREALAKMAA